MAEALATRLDPITFSPGGEEWFEYGPQQTRVGFHDYAAIYAVPGLYEHVFYEQLGMCSAEVVTDAFAKAATGAERVLDLGAGNGIGGERLRAHGVAHLVGLDIEPAAREAALRDRPGVYDDYLVGDVLTMPLPDERFTSLVALSAIGVGHVTVPALERALTLVEPGGLFAFAVTPALMPGSEDPDGIATGYPDFLGALLAAGEISRTEYVHRRQTDGTPHDAVAVVGRLPG